MGYYRKQKNQCMYPSKKGAKDQESIQSSTTPDTGYHMRKTQLNITNKSQEVSPFPAGDHKAAINRRESMTNDPKKKYRLRMVSKNILLEVLNRFQGTNLTISSYLY